MQTTGTQGTRREALMVAARRVVPVIVEMILDSGEEPSAELVTRCMVEYQRQLERFFVAYCDEADLRDEIKTDIVRAAWLRIRAERGAA